MQINLQIPDSLYNTYLERWKSPQHYKKMKDAIDALKDLEQNDRFFIVNGETRRDIEKTLGKHIGDQQELARLIKNMNSVRIQGIEVQFSDDQLFRIDAQAGYHGKTRESFIEDMVKEIVDKFMDEY